MRSLRVLASSLAINFAYTSPSSIQLALCSQRAFTGPHLRILGSLLPSVRPPRLRSSLRFFSTSSSFSSSESQSLSSHLPRCISLSFSIPLCMTESRESGKGTAPGSLDRWLAGTMFHGREQKGRWGGWRKEGKMTRKKCRNSLPKNPTAKGTSNL